MFQHIPPKNYNRGTLLGWGAGQGEMPLYLKSCSDGPLLPPHPQFLPPHDLRVEQTYHCRIKDVCPKT